MTIFWAATCLTALAKARHAFMLTIPSTIWRALIGLLLVPFLQACASPPGRSTSQVIRVDTPGCMRAHCTLSNDLGTWQVDPTPGDVTLMTSEKPLNVSCRSNGEMKGELHLPSAIRPVSAGSGVAGGAVGAGAMGAAGAPILATPYAPFYGFLVVFGAIAGTGVGRAVDTESRTWSYPPTLSVPFSCGVIEVNSAVLAASPLGMAVRSFSFGAPEGLETDAALVTALAPQGRAAAAGLQVGDLIVEVDGRSFVGTLGLQALVQKASQALTLKVVRGEDKLTFVLPLTGRLP